MPATKHSKAVPPIAKSKKAGIHCDFKPGASKRAIRYATDEQAKAAGAWAVEKYHETFKALAK